MRVFALLLVLSWAGCQTEPASDASPDATASAEAPPAEPPAEPDDPPTGTPQFSVGDCTAQSADARLVALDFEPVPCDDPEAQSRIADIIDDPRGCPEGQSGVTPVGPDNPTYCLEGL